jgi:hypothetical protein
MINWKPEALQEAVDAWFGYQVNLSTEIAKQISKALNAAVEAQGDLYQNGYKAGLEEAARIVKDPCYTYTGEFIAKRIKELKDA